MKRKFIIQSELENNFNHYSHEIDFSSIAEWMACGFFLGNNDFTKTKFGSKTTYSLESNWYYAPRDLTFNQASDEFSEIFERLIKEKIKNRKIILPLSGGLDSRTLAAALRNEKNLVSYSYEFVGGIRETDYAKQISNSMGWEFYKFYIEKGYLWNKIDELADINLCQSDFTHPRQMAVINKIAELGNLILSGQWGDVLFDLPRIRKNTSIDELSYIVINKITKLGGLELANRLWEEWGLSNKFEEMLFGHIQKLLLEINIDNPSRRLQAFKSLHWAVRWANPNLKIFNNSCELFSPYYQDKMCDFICTIPDKYLMNRKMQINYLKNKAPNLSEIPWQVYDLNLYNYKYFNSIYLPRRIFRFLKRQVKEHILFQSPVIQRNWELQFLGKKNEDKLRYWLFETKNLNNIVSKNLVNEFYNKFQNHDRVKYSHPISMLLTLSVWCEKFWKKR
ncbi:MAG: asparagine synthase [Candidatus Marinimicrobia bacterium]|nr:asparagine synthase [Candidatus Neomarinimicrobiota bacterium]